MDFDAIAFEALCSEMEKTLNRPLTPQERSALRLSQGAVKPTPFIVEKRTDDDDVDDEAKPAKASD